VSERGANRAERVEQRPVYPLSAVVGQEALVLALVLAAVDRGIGGVLLRGQKGSAKTTAARGLASVLPGRAPFVELPVGASEDRVVGTVDLKAVLRDGEGRFSPGLLAAADGGVLYVDEVNLLPDHVVDVLLDVAASGVNRVEREGISHEHASRFVLLGSMNPEEGELRPQFLDRFGLAVQVSAPTDAAQRAEAVRRRLAFDADPAGFVAQWARAEASLAERLARARPAPLAGGLVEQVARLCVALGAEGLRADLVCCRAAAALAGWEGRPEAGEAEVRQVAAAALAHRRRRSPFESPQLADEELQCALDEAFAPMRAAGARAGKEAGAGAGEGTHGRRASGAEGDASDAAGTGARAARDAPGASGHSSVVGEGASGVVAGSSSAETGASSARAGTSSARAGSSGRDGDGTGGSRRGAARPDAAFATDRGAGGSRAGRHQAVRPLPAWSTRSAAAGDAAALGPGRGRQDPAPAGERGPKAVRSDSFVPDGLMSRSAGGGSPPALPVAGVEPASSDNQATDAGWGLTESRPTASWARGVLGDDRRAVRDRARRSTAAGRRGLAEAQRGRRVGSTVPDGPVSQVAVGASVRAAAARGVSQVEATDVRQAVFEQRTGQLVVLAVDASGSMGAARRIDAAVRAALSLLLDAYQRRDRVALVTFGGDTATVALAPTGSVEVARARLSALATGGRTPLGAGILTALDVAGSASRSGHQPLVVLITDGRATAGPPGNDPLSAALGAAGEVRRAGVRAVVVDAEDGDIRLGLAGVVADTMGARYVAVGEMTGDEIAQVVRAEARSGEDPASGGVVERRY
jgi:magnesium chelatase subunit D